MRFNFRSKYLGLWSLSIMFLILFNAITFVDMWDFDYEVMLFKDDPCQTKTNEAGVCTRLTSCTVYMDGLRAGTMEYDSFLSCGFDDDETAVICCPINGIQNDNATTPLTTTTTTANTINRPTQSPRKTTTDSSDQEYKDDDEDATPGGGLPVNNKPIDHGFSAKTTTGSPNAEYKDEAEGAQDDGKNTIDFPDRDEDIPFNVNVLVPDVFPFGGGLLQHNKLIEAEYVDESVERGAE